MLDADVVQLLRGRHLLLQQSQGEPSCWRPEGSPVSLTAPPSTQAEPSASLHFHLEVGGPHRSAGHISDQYSPFCSHQPGVSGHRVGGPLQGAMAVHESVLTVKIACGIQQLPDVQGVDLQGGDNPFFNASGASNTAGDSQVRPR